MKIPKKTSGIGSAIYLEWLIPIWHYHLILEKKEKVFEVYIPLVISALCTGIYWFYERIDPALEHLAELLPTAVSILIGFTAMLITLLLTSTSESVDKLKKFELDKEIGNDSVTLFQGLHIQFAHSLFSEILLIVIVFIYLFLKGVYWASYLEEVFLFAEIFFVLNILLSILRGIANLYFSFFNIEDDK